MKKTLFSILAVVLIGTQAVTAQTKWALDKSHTDIRFTATHMVISEVDGEFKEVDGTVETTSDDFVGAQVQFVAKVASIDTDNERRDGHLKSDDFFNAEMYPEIKFNGKIVKEGDNLSTIADRFGIPLAALIIWNRIDIKRPIHPGKRLIIYRKDTKLD